MKVRRSIFMLLALAAVLLVIVFAAGCAGEQDKTADQKQADIQANNLSEMAREVGNPAIKNFREKKMAKLIYEMRDQMNLATFTYAENLTPAVVRGHTACGGKFTFIGRSIGYGLPYATQCTASQSNQRFVYPGGTYDWIVLPQAEPNGLYMPDAAAGTWVMMVNPRNATDVRPVYFENNVIVTQFEYPLD